MTSGPRSIVPFHLQFEAVVKTFTLQPSHSLAIDPERPDAPFKTGLYLNTTLGLARFCTVTTLSWDQHYSIQPSSLNQIILSIKRDSSTDSKGLHLYIVRPTTKRTCAEQTI